MNTQLEIPAIAVLGPALAVFAVVAVARRRRRVAGWSGGSLLLRVVAALYGAAVLALTLFPLWIYAAEYRNQTPWLDRLQWVPLLVADLSMVPNVVMFVPLGFLLPLLTRRCATLGRTVAVSAVVSLGIEATQLLLYVVCGNGRSTDVNDVIANTLGGLAGYACLRAAQRVGALRRAIDRLEPVATA